MSARLPFRLLLVLIAVASAAVLPPLASGVSPYFNVVMPDDPVGYWSLTEAPGSATAGDGSGNVYQGTYRNGVTLGVAGATPNGDDAARFDG